MLELETERLNFRQWQESDFETIANFYADEEKARFVGGKKSREHAWRLMATYIGHYHLKGYSYLALEEKETKRFVGTVGLWNSGPWPEMEMGYWFLFEMHGKGYATEATKVVKDFAFQSLKVDTLVSYIDPENKPSQKLALRIGAKYDKTIDLLGLGDHQVYRYSK